MFLTRPYCESVWACFYYGKIFRRIVPELLDKWNCIFRKLL